MPQWLVYYISGGKCLTRYPMACKSRYILRRLTGTCSAFATAPTAGHPPRQPSLSARLPCIHHYYCCEQDLGPCPQRCGRPPFSRSDSGSVLGPLYVNAPRLAGWRPRPHTTAKYRTASEPNRTVLRAPYNPGLFSALAFPDLQLKPSRVPRLGWEWKRTPIDKALLSYSP